MPTPTFALIPGVEITHGHAGAQHHGDVDLRHSYGDPVTAAERWIAQGATWLHVGDLDATFGSGSNAEAVRHVLTACRGRVQVALAGGIRDQAGLDAALHTGVAQVVLDTAALADPEFVRTAIRQHSRRIAVSITAHGTALSAPGTSVDGADLAAALRLLDEAGCPAYIVNDMDSRGLRKQSGREALVAACEIVRGAVLAGGGIQRLEDLHALMDLRLPALTGAVIDQALYVDAFSLAEAQAAIAPRYDPWEWGPARP